MAGGTVLCGVDDTPSAHGAAGMAAALAARLGLRLVLAHVIDGRLSGRRKVEDGRREHWEVALERLADELPACNGVEVRVEVGDRAELFAQLAAEEGADLIVLGSRARRLRDRWLGCPLARELEAVTPVPILIAPPQTRRRSARRLAVAAAASG